MSEYSNAGFILTPNAWKVSKMYALKPVPVLPNAAPFSIPYVRSTVANRRLANASYAAMSINEPLLNYNAGDTCPFWLYDKNRTNLILNNAVVVTQDCTVTAVPYTLSFVGTGTITLSGTHVASLVGTGATDRVVLTFTPTAGTLTLTITGTVTIGQLEAGQYATNPITTAGSPVTRDYCYTTFSGLLTSGFVGTSGGSLNIVFKNVQKGLGAITGYFGDTAKTAIEFGGSNLSTINLWKRDAGVQGYVGATPVSTSLNIVITYSATAMLVYINGALRYTITQAVDLTSFTTLYLSSIDFSFQISKCELYATQLTGVEAIALSNE